MDTYYEAGDEMRCQLAGGLGVAWVGLVGWMDRLMFRWWRDKTTYLVFGVCRFIPCVQPC